MLKLNRVSVLANSKIIVRGVELTLGPQELIALMGPNGSGKTSLALALAGHPNYQLQGKVILDKKAINNLSPEERAKEGLFVAFQNPISIPGIDIFSLLWEAISNQKKPKWSFSEFKELVKKEARILGIEERVLEGASKNPSGGERKKLEILQAMILKPKYAIFDEPDSGLDTDSLKVVAQRIKYLAKKQKTGCLLITHYSHLFTWLKPQKILVMRKGKIVAKGGIKLAEKIEKKGYKAI